MVLFRCLVVAREGFIGPEILEAMAFREGLALTKVASGYLNVMSPERTGMEPHQRINKRNSSGINWLS
jgi:hypothetical protein